MCSFCFCFDFSSALSMLSREKQIVIYGMGSRVFPSYTDKASHFSSSNGGAISFLFFFFSFSEAIPLSSSLSMWRECLSSRASRVKPAPSGMIPRQRQPRGTPTPSLPASGRPYPALAGHHQ